MRNIRLFTYLLLAVLVTNTACEEDDPSPVKVNFSNSEAGISKSNSSAEFLVEFSRPSESDGTLSVTIDNGSLTYGEDADFYTSPAASNLKMSVPYSVGDESVRIMVSSGSALNIAQDESVTLTISDPSQVLGLGSQTTITVMFSENFVALSGSTVLDAGGSEFTHQAYFDLSKIKQTKIDKYAWDLGFYSGSDFRVIINNAAKMMAQQIDKTDLTKVTAEDTVGFGATQSFDAFNGNAVDWVDLPDGDLDSLALNTISATDSENKVYIISREGDERNWKKVRILQNGSGYTLQYADIAATTFESVDISKDEVYNFSFFDLDNGTTAIEPAKESWDIMYSSFTNLTFFGYYLPYSFNDFIIINRNSTTAVEVLTDEISYEDFELADAESISFDASQDVIGSNWRNGGGPGVSPSIKEDRFYVITDSEENIYKLKFKSMYSEEDGERGYTEIEFELLK